MSLKNGLNKMSKSDPSDQSRINLMDDSISIIKKIQKARTDSEPFPKSLEEMDNRPEINNLINIFSALSEDLPQNIIAQYVGKDFKFFKADLSDLVNQKISNISKEMNKLLKDLNYLDLILKKGCQKANEIAEKNVKDLKKIIGFFEA